VDGARHFFMEVNTRIQVEHRVTEMVYSLRFRNPRDATETIEIESLVEAMLWLAVHGKSLPRPERVPRHGSGAEARVNATNDALRPHAGGMVLDWTAPVEHELRDDQGIGIRNPDTGTFMPYRLAGAYDSNAALIVSHGTDREDNFRRLAEILRRSELRGDDVITNMPFHYGLLHWMLGADPMVKPSTRFVQGYLAQVGALKIAAQRIDLEIAWQALEAEAATLGAAAARALAAKVTLLPRPVERLLEHPHLLAGWLAPRAQRRWELVQGRVEWRQNPLAVLDTLYGYLRWEDRPGVTPEEKIWSHDQEMLADGLAFYAEVQERVGGAALAWPELAEQLSAERPPEGIPAAQWPAVQAAHRGHQLGLELLKLPVLMGHEAGYFHLHVNERLEPVLPPEWADPGRTAAALTALAPPPPAASNAVLAWTGGTFYARPSPNDPPYVTEGQHLEAGEQVGLLEVMKMFNPLRVAFACTVTRVRIDQDTGSVVAKGQLLYEVRPDLPPVTDDPAARQTARAAWTREILARL
jgi:biotin carboxyl carrier protein